MEAVVTDPRERGGFSARLGAYVALTKPRIIELLLITTVPAMVLAAGGWPGTWLVATTLIGGTLSAAGANALNSYYDTDIDAHMRRTARRPLPAHRVPARHAVILGWVLGVAGFVWLWATTNLLAAALSTAAFLFYVYGYTRYLKRATDQNIVIGGAAGAAPVLVGWAAVTGTLDLPAWLLFALVFYWTPPHFWALALRYRDDYAAAGVPMLPVTRGVEATLRHILVYSGLMVLISLALVPSAGLRWVYLLTAIVAGSWFLVESLRVFRTPERAIALFGTSTAYLAAISAAIVVDVLVF